MTSSAKSSKTINVLLWITQILLAVTLIWSGSVKIFQSVETLALMWPWAGEVSPALVKLTGVVDLLGAIGLILPSMLRIKPQLTAFAALGIILLMICAIVFHVSRGEGSSIGINIAFIFLAAFVAWGRFSKAPIAPK